MKNVWWLPTTLETQALGAALARTCPWGVREARVVHLSGELGSGKTSLTAAALAALGVQEAVRSPTYALVETYPLRTGFAVHADLYRLAGAEELDALGLRDQLQANTLMLIEWPERAAAAIPKPDLILQLLVVDQGRECRIEAGSDAGAAWLALMEQLLPSQV